MTLGVASGVDPLMVLPLVDMARWSTNVEVRARSHSPFTPRSFPILTGDFEGLGVQYVAPVRGYPRIAQRWGAGYASL